VKWLLGLLCSCPLGFSRSYLDDNFSESVSARAGEHFVRRNGARQRKNATHGYRISDDTSVTLLAKYTNGPLKLYGGYDGFNLRLPAIRRPLLVILRWVILEAIRDQAAFPLLPLPPVPRQGRGECERPSPQ
jgi:hypothetical protein